VKKSQLPVRLALRAEGDKWNAYITKPDTMDGAIRVGSIALRFVEGNQKRKDAFIALMTEPLAEMMKEMYGEKPSWEQRPARDREKTKE
jgi:hypothetical protein